MSISGSIPFLGEDELERIDALVSEYLLFRSFKQTQQQLFLDKRLPSINGHGRNGEAGGGRHQRATVQRLLNALDSGDYPRMITLWDSYVTQKIGSVKSSLLGAEARSAEFLVHLTCAVYPFRSEVIQSAGNPAMAAKCAARSMTIFKNFLETRGQRLIQAEEEFAPYRSIFKIAFPPTHPQYKHIFSSEWIANTRGRITSFLEKFFSPSDVPVLCHLFERLGTKTESELKEIFRRRERKLLKFARSVHTLSSDLLSAFETGKSIDKTFLTSMRNRFNTFEEVLRPDDEFEEEMGSDSPQWSSTDIDPTLPLTKRLSPQRLIAKKASNNSSSATVNKIADLGHLDWASVSRDVAFMSSEVGSEIAGLLTRDYILSPADAAMKCEIGMHGCVLLHALIQYILRPDKEIQSKSARDAAVTALCRADILGLRTATTLTSFVDLSSGSIGLESRSVTRFMFSLAEATKKIPEPAALIYDANDSEEGVAKMPSYEKLLGTGEIIAEYVCRILAALATSPVGVSYLHTFGVRITAAFADFLVALPTPENNEERDGDPRSHRRGGSDMQTWTLIALIRLTCNSKTNQLVVLKRGAVSWLSKTLGQFVSDAQNDLRTVDMGEPEQPDPSAIASQIDKIITTHFGADVFASTVGATRFDLSLSLLHTIVCSAEAQRYLVGSVNMQRETESLASVLTLLLVGEGRSELQASLIASTLKVLLRETTTRDTSRTSAEVLVLRRSYEQRRTMSIDHELASSLLGIVDSTAQTTDDASSSTSEDSSEILEATTSLQASLDDNPSLAEYASGVPRTGLAFLLRYTSSAGRIFQGEEASEESKDAAATRARSPPIQTHAIREAQSKENAPKVPRTPPRGGNAKKISHGRVFSDDDEGGVEGGDEYSPASKGKKKQKANKKDLDDEEDEDEEEGGEEEQEEGEQEDQEEEQEQDGEEGQDEQPEDEQPEQEEEDDD